MIEIQAKIHDRFSVEFKVGFVTRRKLRLNNFVMNTWIFVPNGLDINALTYSKGQFYKDVKSNVRLITPVFPLGDIVDGSAIPLHHLQEAFDRLAGDQTRTALAEYEYHIKMFTAILKSALRDEIQRIIGAASEGDIECMCTQLASNLESIASRYRDLRRIIDVPTVAPGVQDYFQFGDEFMSNIMELYLFKLIRWLQQRPVKHGQVADRLAGLVRSETEYKRRMGYVVVEKESPTANRDIVFRQGVLKKYVESELFLNAKRRKDGVLVEQVYYSLAAGMSMIFATVVAFSVQQTYGNFTMPLFVALVVSYMLKDRIKELMRYYFAHRLKKKYFDNKTTVSIQGKEIGWIKEGVDFITDDKTPREVMEIRSRSTLLEAENRVSDEKIILYRKVVQLDREKLEQGNQYAISGINDIVRLHLTHFTQKMDNPEIPLYLLDAESNAVLIDGQKVYYINLVMQFQFEDSVNYKRYRLVVSRDGIREIEEMK